MKGQEGHNLWYPVLAFNLCYASNDGFDLLKCFMALNI